MEIMRNLIREGKSIILITHKLKEIKAIADRCTVIRRGKVIGTVDVKSTSESEMARMMVGREVSFTVDKEKTRARRADTGDRGPFRSGADRNILGVKNFSLQVRAGEILGLAGVDGNGQTELVEALTGLRSIESGRILLKGKDISSDGIHQRIRAGISPYPGGPAEARPGSGLQRRRTILFWKPTAMSPLQNTVFSSGEPIRKHARKIMEDFDVRAGEGAVTRARALSGGNQQKAIVGREIDLDPDLLIAATAHQGSGMSDPSNTFTAGWSNSGTGAKAVLLVSLELD